MITFPRAELNDNDHFRVLRLLEQNPVRTQRELAAALGISVGKTNHLLRTLVDRGHLQPDDYPPAERMARKCSYLLTPEGLQHRRALTRAYLERRTREFEALHAELTSLRAELGHAEAAP